MFNCCTYFDSRYAAMGMALRSSLAAHIPDHRLHVLCLDSLAIEIVAKARDPRLVPVELGDVEQRFPALLQVKPTRSKVDYIFTLTPALCSHLLKSVPDIDSITYLDADLYFFESPTALFTEIETSSVAIIEHRHVPRLMHLYRQFGIYNVGWLTFRNDSEGLKVVEWWRERCLEWCYDRVEDGKFADQRYLDSFPELSPAVHVIQHTGANAARWNVGNYRLSDRDGRVFIGEEPLLFYHFEGLRQVGPELFDMGLRRYELRADKILRQRIYAPYINALREAQHRIAGRQPPTLIPSRRGQTSTSFARRALNRARAFVSSARLAARGDALRG